MDCRAVVDEYYSSATTDREIFSSDFLSCNNFTQLYIIYFTYQNPSIVTLYADIDDLATNYIGDEFTSNTISFLEKKYHVFGNKICTIGTLLNYSPPPSL